MPARCREFPGNSTMAAVIAASSAGEADSGAYYPPTMPVRWNIDHARKRVEARADGEMSASNVMGYLAAVAAAGGMPYAKLFDASEAKAKMSTDELRSLGAWVRTWAIEGHGPVGPLAIVSSPGNQLDAAHFADAAGSTRLLRIFRRERKLAHGSIRPVYHRQADALGAPARPSPFAIPAPPASPQSLH